MQHWKQHSKLRIYDVNYDDVISDTENIIRQLISDIGLKWEEECLHYQYRQRSRHRRISIDCST